MKKSYLFSPLNHVFINHYDLDKNPYSGYTCSSLDQAYAWAKVLLNTNKPINAIQFKAEGGKKTYVLYRLLENTVELFTQGYITSLFWSEGEEFDYSTFSDLSDGTYCKIKQDCQEFCKKVERYITPDNLDNMAHDFVLTRNHHGAGFWDGDWPEIGDKLTKIAQSFPEQEIYFGDDGKIYA